MSTDREKIAKRRQRRRRRRLKLSAKIAIFFIVLIFTGGIYTGVKYFRMRNAPDPYGKLEDIQNAYSNNYDLSDEVLPSAKYWVIDVGDGESIYIKCGQIDILIDTGSDKEAKAILDTISGELTGDLDYLFITSLSPRRIGGLWKVCNAFNPGKLITCPLGDRLREIRFSAPNVKLEEGTTTTISLGDNAYLSVFRPEVSSDDPLDQSLMTLFKYGNTAFFAESDAGEEEEARVIEQLDKCDALVLARGGSDKVNQHIGDISCSTYIVSCAKGAGPSDALIENVKGAIYATYICGTIKFATNGNEVESSVEQNQKVKNSEDTAEEEAKKAAEAKE